MKLSLLALLISVPLLAQPYDVVLANGRVIDPESNLDSVRNVGIRGGRIAAVSSSSLDGRTVVDVKGLVVTAGFIDVHSHGQTPENYAFKARDGVTTALEMEVGANPVSPWYAAREGRSLINFGATSGHIPARMMAMRDTGKLLPRDAAANRAATAEGRKQAWMKAHSGSDWASLIHPKRHGKRSWRYSSSPRSGGRPSMCICAAADRSSLARWMRCKK